MSHGFEWSSLATDSRLAIHHGTLKIARAHLLADRSPARRRRSLLIIPGIVLEHGRELLVVDEAAVVRVV